MPILSTSGVNYDLGAPIHVRSGVALSNLELSSVRATDLETMSTLHLDFAIDGRFSGLPVRFESRIEGCGSACRSGNIGAIAPMTFARTVPVEIVRFAKQGEATLSDSVGGLRGALINSLQKIGLINGTTIKWLVTMESGRILAGAIEPPRRLCDIAQTDAFWPNDHSGSTRE